MKRYQSILGGAVGVCSVAALSACGPISNISSRPVVTTASHSTSSPVVVSSSARTTAGDTTPMTADPTSSATTVTRVLTPTPRLTSQAEPSEVSTPVPSSVKEPPVPSNPTGAATQAPTAETSVVAIGSAPAGSSGGFAVMNVTSELPRLGANRLYVPKLGINTSIVAAPVKAGALVVPGATKVGRWTGSVGYGAKTGRAVIAGHTLSYGRYKGALAPIARATKGTVIYVSDSAGRVYRFRVTVRAEMTKSALPADVFYGRDSMKLELVTCGGVILRGGHHKDNVVVTAVRF